MKAITVDGETRALRPGETITTEPLAVSLTAPELREAAVELAGLLDHEANAGREIAEILRACRAEQARRRKEIERLTRLVADGAETRPVPCALVRDEDAATVRCVRQDTSEQVWERPMTLSERQGELYAEEADEVPPVLRPELAKAKGPRRKRSEAAA